MMKRFTLLMASGWFILSLNSCFVNRTTVADGPIGKEKSIKYAKAKQMYLFWGLVPIGQAQPRTPVECGYQVKSVFNFWDMLVSTITGGIFDLRTVKILVRKESPCDPAVMKLERKIEKKESHEQ